MAEISLCMIVKDESSFLKKCLESLSPNVNEIIIVDTGSSDNTKSIASQYTSLVFDFPWQNDFSKARNFSMSKATKPWILILDADESISSSDFETLKAFKETEADALYFTWRDYMNESEGPNLIQVKNDIYEESAPFKGFIPSQVLRFFKNKKEYQFEGIIHETVQNSILKNSGKISDSPVVIHHFGSALRSKEELSKKRDLYISLLKQKLENKEFNEKPEFYICFEIATEYLIKNSLEEAKFYLKKSISLNQKFPKSLAKLGHLLLIEGNLTEAEKFLTKSLELDNTDPSVYKNLGVLYTKQNNYKKAIENLEKAISINPYSAQTYFNLGVLYSEENNKEKASQCFNMSISLNPSYKNKLKHV